MVSTISQLLLVTTTEDVAVTNSSLWFAIVRVQLCNTSYIQQMIRILVLTEALPV